MPPCLKAANRVVGDKVDAASRVSRLTRTCYQPNYYLRVHEKEERLLVSDALDGEKTMLTESQVDDDGVGHEVLIHAAVGVQEEGGGSVPSIRLHRA